MTGIAPANADVTSLVTFYLLALGQLECPHAPEESEEANKQADDAKKRVERPKTQGHATKLTDASKYEMYLKPIAGAFVWIERMHPLQQTLQVLYGQTNRHGLVYESTESDPDRMAKPPDDDATEVVARHVATAHGANFLLYWSLDPELFRCFVREVQKAQGTERDAVLDRFGAQRIQATFARQVKAPLELFSYEQRMAAATYLFAPSGQFHAYRDLATPLLDVTPRSLRSLYQVEAIRWYGLYGPEKAGKHLGALWRALQLVEMSKHNLSDAWLDEELRGKDAGYLPKHGSPEREALEAYRDFAWQCARLRPGQEGTAGWQDRPSMVRRERFETSLAVTARSWSDTSADWLEAADEIGRGTNGACVHPGYRTRLREHRERLILSPVHRDYLRVYYDLYRVGFLLQARLDFQGDLGARLEAAFDDLQTRVDDCHQLQGQLMMGLPFGAFMHDLARSRGEPNAHAALLTRYINASWNVGVAWWREFDHAQRQAAWDDLKPVIKLLTAPAGAAQKLLAAIYARPFLSLVQSQDAAQEAINQHYTLGQLMQGKALVLDDIPSGSASVELDPDTDEVHVLLDGVTRTRSATPVQIKPKGSVRRWLRDAGKLAAMRGSVRGGKIVIENVPVPADPARLKALAKEMPAQLSVACDTLDYALALLGASASWEQGGAVDKFWLCYELGSGLAGVANNVHALAQAFTHDFRSVGPLLESVHSLTKGVGEVTSYIDTMRSLYEGYTLLFYSDDIGYEVKRGRGLRAAAITLKGSTKIVTGAVKGALALETLTAAGAAAGASEAAAVGATEAVVVGTASLPVALVVVIGGSLVLCAAEVYLAFSADFAPQVEAFLRAIDDAIKEQGPSPDEDQSQSAALKVSDQLAAFNGFVERTLLH